MTYGACPTIRRLRFVALACVSLKRWIVLCIAVALLKTVNGVNESAIKERSFLISTSTPKLSALSALVKNTVRVPDPAARYTRSIGRVNFFANSATLITSPLLGYHSQRRSAFVTFVRERFSLPCVSSPFRTSRLLIGESSRYSGRASVFDSDSRTCCISVILKLNASEGRTSFQIFPVCTGEPRVESASTSRWSLSYRAPPT